MDSNTKCNNKNTWFLLAKFLKIALISIYFINGVLNDTETIVKYHFLAKTELFFEL